MRKAIFVTIAWAVICLSLPAQRLPAQSGPAVIVVRHAEKASDPADDPALSPAGERRAEALAGALAGARVDTIITTHYLRTRRTAAPIALARGLTPIVVRPGSDTAAHAREVAKAVRARPAGEVVLVVGHSNTVPAIIAALGGPQIQPLCETEYANLFTLILEPGGGARFIRSSYGTPDPPAAADCNRTMIQR